MCPVCLFIIVFSQIWLSPLDMGIPVIFFCVFYVYYLHGISQVSRLFRKGDYIEGSILDISEGDGALSGCFLVEYQYEFQGTHYESEYFVHTIENYTVNGLASLLVNPDQPKQSMLYLFPNMVQ
jgi:hypothetical protein